MRRGDPDERLAVRRRWADRLRSRPGHADRGAVREAWGQAGSGPGLRPGMPGAAHRRSAAARGRHLVRTGDGRRVAAARGADRRGPGRGVRAGGLLRVHRDLAARPRDRHALPGFVGGRAKQSAGVAATAGPAGRAPAGAGGHAAPGESPEAGVRSDRGRADHGRRGERGVPGGPVTRVADPAHPDSGLGQHSEAAGRSQGGPRRGRDREERGLPASHGGRPARADPHHAGQAGAESESRLAQRRGSRGARSGRRRRPQEEYRRRVRRRVRTCCRTP
jgi:hypothetical protein